MTSSTTVHSPLRLYGRSGELAVLYGMSARLRQGDGGALVLAAPPGLGRTALLREAAAAHRPYGPVLYADGPHALAVPSAGTEPPTPDALLARLRERAAGRPLLVCADDAHAWDPACRAALGQTARRLGAGSPITLLIATDDGPALPGLPALRLGPLDEEASAALLDRLASAAILDRPAGAATDPYTGTGVLDPVVRAELLREAAGNPGLLTGLTHRLTPDQLTGRAPLPCPLPGAEGVLQAYAYRLNALPAHTRVLLLLAAAAQEHEPAGTGADALLLLRAGTRAGLPRDFLDEALFGPSATWGLLQRSGSRAHVTPPLAARALLHHAPPSRRRAAHELLAALLEETADRTGTPDARPAGTDACPAGTAARPAGADTRPASSRAVGRAAPLAALVQRACAAPGPDEALAARLEAAATAPYPHAERASALARAATLTSDPLLRTARLAVAAEQAALAGTPDRARALLARIAAPTESQPAHAPAPATRGGGRAPEPGHPASVRVPARAHGGGPAGGPRPTAEPGREPAPGRPAPDRASTPPLDQTPAPDRAPARMPAPGPGAGRLAPYQAPGPIPDRAPASVHPHAPTAAGPGTALVPYVHGLLALRTGPAVDAYEALLAAAALLGPLDPGRAIGALLGAAEAAWVRGDAVGYLEAMGRVDPVPYGDAFASYRAGMCAVLAGRTAEGHALLRRCLDLDGTGDPAGLLRAGVAALVLGEVAAACRIGARALGAVRTRGPEALLPQALEHLAYAELRAGLHAAARAHALEGLHAARRTGQPNSSVPLHAVLALAASVEGPAEACAAHCEAALAGAVPHGLTQPATLATWARARADLAAGRPEEAAARLGPLVRPGPRQGHFAARMLAVPCYVEAVTLGGRGGELLPVVDEFAGWADRTADPQAPAQLARCRALLAPAEEADARYGEALAHHERAGGDFERARTLLLYGQWLRRRRRTREARTPLRDALVAFQRCSARAWAERAGGELRAAGEPVLGAARDTGGDGVLAALTPQQQRIARCVAEGATNREVALRLSLSPRTVDHHLRNVFAALSIRSRTELARLLGPQSP